MATSKHSNSSSGKNVRSNQNSVRYRTVVIDGLGDFYREAGPSHITRRASVKHAQPA
ncbi:hypothetical protein [Thiobacillus sp.]